MKKNHLVLSVLSLCISQQLYAQTDTLINDTQNQQNIDSYNSTDLEEKQMPSAIFETIKVKDKAKTGIALAQKISEMPAVTQVITENEIHAQSAGSRTTGEILAQLIPSLGTTSGSTSNYGTTMHGRPVQFLLNGVPLTGSRNLSRELNSIDPAQLERVEVLSGATSIYGSGAAGGLINLVTKSMDGYGFKGQTRIGMSSARDFDSDSLGHKVGQTMAYGGESVWGRLDVDYEDKGGQFDSHGRRISPDVNQTDQQDTQSLSVNANIGANIDDSQSIDLAVTYYKDEQDTDYGPDYGDNLKVLLGKQEPSLRAVDGAHVKHQPETRKTSVNLSYNNDDFLNSNLNITGYYRDEKGRFYPSGKTVDEQAAQIWAANGVTDKDKIKKLAGAAVIVAQSEADIEVAGLRAAMQTEIDLGNKPTLISYGADFEREKSEQTYYGQDFNKFWASNGLVSTPDGQAYNGGPDTTTDKYGIFVNGDIDLSDKWHASAGVRYQKIKAETDRFVPLAEQVLENYFNDPSIAPKAAAYGIDYKAGYVEPGDTNHHKTLFNIGTSYQITPEDQIFANFSQGFTTADLQRALRDVRGGFVVNSDNVDPIEVDNYELGWQGTHGNTQARLSGFYNESDKTVRFNDDYTVEVIDTDERVYGAEASISQKLNNNWQLGGTLAYTRGQYKKDGEWLELGADRLSPLKGTAFAQYNFDEGSNIRLQALAIGGSDRAFKDQKKDSDSSANAISGYATFDLLGQVQLGEGKGKVDYGVYNLLNKDYINVYHQANYGAMNRLPSQGTTYGISYTIDY
ncbi:TonB-dependent receptor [Psychrobacter phenylpyruvicus]|uniref:Iron-regulated outer membrane proteins n=1 Tax=Psychrobacter phenylpyruvicus TaxID=29432 RepID=A0A379LJU7_9GAMM|nr:TonB-dependent receptor [Psychrobacter phenylpyruvicus]SUD90818.1 Iron-regulated outer membrane proteins [Psychrobacter phenylpyruvicus]